MLLASSDGYVRSYCKRTSSTGSKDYGRRGDVTLTFERIFFSLKNPILGFDHSLYERYY